MNWASMMLVLEALIVVAVFWEIGNRLADAIAWVNRRRRPRPEPATTTAKDDERAPSA